VRKAAWYWYNNRHVDQGNRKEVTAEVKAKLSKSATKIWWRKGSLLNKWCWEN
jgi:hypothetical protein